MHDRGGGGGVAVAVASARVFTWIAADVGGVGAMVALPLELGARRFRLRRNSIELPAHLDTTPPRCR